MRLLVLGGTAFLGRHIVNCALSEGHQITLFNRGKRNPQLFPQAEKLRGNRDSDLSGLDGREWDAVIDTCGYLPRVVEKSASKLSRSVGHYTFISSLSVYSNTSKPGLDETGDVGGLANPSVEEINGETYGPLKVLCERVVEKYLPGRTLSVRAGLIVGPDDYTGRFGYWPQRVSEGGQVLAPCPPDQPVQVIDVRDLAEWLLQMVGSQRAGTFNATGPDYVLTMGHFLAECKRVCGSNAYFTWVDEKFLLEQGIRPWQDLPLWLAQETSPEHAGFTSFSCQKAFAAGLTFRPLSDTIEATLHSQQGKAGISRDRERELLEIFRNQ